MELFIARIAVTQDFAKEHASELGQYFSKMMDHFPKTAMATLVSPRFTFAVLTMFAETKEACRESVERAWKMAFPKEDYYEILVSAFGDDEKNDVYRYTKGIYMNFYGMDDFIRRTTELLERIPHLKELGAEDVIKKQNYLCAIDPGCGFSTIVSAISSLLIAHEIYPKPEDGREMAYCELTLGAEEKNGFFDEEYQTSDSMYYLPALKSAFETKLDESMKKHLENEKQIKQTIPKRKEKINFYHNNRL